MPLFFYLKTISGFPTEVIRIKLLSIDQATVKTGIALRDDNTLVAQELINLTKTDKSERVDAMAAELHSRIHKYKPHFVVFEDVALQSNPATLMLLARLQGAIIGFCVLYNIPYEILKPPNWRKILGFTQGQGIKRNELKKQAVAYVKNKYGLNLSEDVCEAVCIGDAFLLNNNCEI